MRSAIFSLALLTAILPSFAETIPVPLDHFADGSPSIALEYALADPSDPAKPSVFVIADAQQFYVRADRMEEIRDDLFGEGFNVVGIVGRGVADGAAETCRREGGTVDWLQAHRVFRSIALAHLYPAGRLLIVRDNHTFDAMKQSGHYRALIRAFLQAGFDSALFRQAQHAARSHIWQE